MASPLAQFEIKKILPIEFSGYDLSFTNSSLMMILTVISISFFLFLGLRKSSLVPNRLQSIIEISYEFIGDMIGDNIGKEGIKYYPFIFTIFFFHFNREFNGYVAFQFYLD